MTDIDTKSSETCPIIEQYIHKYALLYSKCAKGLDSNVSPKEMNKELMRMAGYNYVYFLN